MVSYFKYHVIRKIEIVDIDTDVDGMIIRGYNGNIAAAGYDLINRMFFN